MDSYSSIPGTTTQEKTISNAQTYHVDILRPTTTERCPLRVAKNQEFVNGWDYDMISTSERCPPTVEAVCGVSSVLLMFKCAIKVTSKTQATTKYLLNTSDKRIQYHSILSNTTLL